ncbi:MAG: hypothetical protein L6V93_15540 [Clostridiales bacterium]|nr:MAG: hypothetical protein L6V93_15540 [Clostridiales bacterium]
MVKTGARVKNVVSHRANGNCGRSAQKHTRELTKSPGSIEDYILDVTP